MKLGPDETAKDDEEDKKDDEANTDRDDGAARFYKIGLCKGRKLISLRATPVGDLPSI